MYLCFFFLVCFCFMRFLLSQCISWIIILSLQNNNSTWIFFYINWTTFFEHMLEIWSHILVKTESKELCWFTQSEDFCVLGFAASPRFHATGNHESFHHHCITGSVLPKARRRRSTSGLENISTRNWFKFSRTKCKVLNLGNNNKNFC